MCLDQKSLGNSVYSKDHLDKRWEGIVGGGWCAHVQEGADVPPPQGCTVEPIHGMWNMYTLRPSTALVEGHVENTYLLAPR